MEKNEEEFIKKEGRFQVEALPSTSTVRDRDRTRRENTVGILRLDLGKPRRSSGSSVEFRNPVKLAAQACVEPVSPQPSVDRLSVTFATEEPSVISMEKVRFEPDSVPSEAEEDEDYSQSVSAIFQRKASTRRSRKRRRSSSPLFAQEADDSQNAVRNRRRSSVFTTSSGDTAISVEDAVQEQILQNIKLHKEVLSSVKQQPWNMRRKLRLVRQAQAYIRRHEGELQERLAQSRSTRDILARFNIVLIKHWQHTKRELANLMNVLIPWEIRIKEIESHFGSVVASYFTFLRWLFWVNLVTAVVLIVFVAVPEMLMANKQKAGMRKKIMEDEKANATNLFTLWDFDGVLRYSPLFYGYYSNQDPEDKSLAKSIGYRMPLAYFLTELVVYIYSFVAILRRMAENSRQSKLSEKDDECVFTWKLFTGWDYMIGNSETAHNRTASIILGFKEALLEEAEKKRDEGRNWKVTSLRVFAHLNVLWLLGSSVYAVILVVHRSTQPEAENGWWRKNEITIVVSLITTLFPAFFEVLGIIEQYHPRKKLRMQLARIMALNLLNIYTLIFASFSKINEMSNILQALRPQNFSTSQPPLAAQQVGAKFPKSLSQSKPYTYEWNSTLSVEKFMNCRNITVPCFSTPTTMMTILMSVLIANSTITPLSSSSSSDGSSFSSVSTLPSTPLYNTSSQSLTTSPQLTQFDDTTSSNLETYSSLDPYTTIDFAIEFDDDQINDFKDSDEFLSVNSIFTDSTVSESVQESSETFTNTNVPSSSETTQLTELINDDVTVENSAPSNSFPTSIEFSDQDFDFTSSSTSSDSVSPESMSVEQICIKTVCDNVPPDQSTTTSTDLPISLPVSTTKTTATTTTSNTVSPDMEVLQYSDLTAYIDSLDADTCKKLQPLCWETMFGREMVKLTVMDLVMTVLSTLMVDFFRALFVRFMNNCWCWDLEKKFPQYGDFKIAENILHLVNNQGMVWMGMFFSPGLPLINIIKLAIMMYLRSWAVLTCNVPHEVVFRASRSNNFYLALLLTMLFLCVLPVGYAVVWVVPSWHCGPFSNYQKIYYIFTKSLKKALPYKSLHKAFDYMASPGIVIPLLMLLVLIIYYLISLTSALREANNDLKIQLRRERTEERRKMFQLVDKKRKEAENPVFKWRKALPNSPSGKLSIADISIDILKAGAVISNGTAKYDSKHKELIDEFMKKAKRMPSGTSEEENGVQETGEGTDIEHQDSLPYDISKVQKYSELLLKKDETKKKMLKEEDITKGDCKKKYPKEKHSMSKEREDSINSGWSEIPEIRIIQTESAERLDDVGSQTRTKKNSDTDIDSEEKFKVIKKKLKKGKSQQKINQISDTKLSNKNMKNNKHRKELNFSENDSKDSPEKTKKAHKQKGSTNTKESRISSRESHTLDVDVNDEENQLMSDNDEEDENNKSKFIVRKVKSGNNKLKKLQNTKSQLNTTNKGIKKVKAKDNKSTEESFENKSIHKSNTVESSNDSEESDEHTESEDDDMKGDIKEDNYKDQSDTEDDSDKENSGDENDVEDFPPDGNKRKDHKRSQQDIKKLTSDFESGESGESDVSSQNTVKHVSLQQQQKESREEDINKKQVQTNSQKVIERFKIANVLLNEARRRSSSGLEGS